MPESPEIAETRITCIHCGYNLSATALGGRCPECGAAVVDSIARLRHTERGPTRESEAMYVARVVGMCMFCLFSGPFSITFYRWARRERASGWLGDYGMRFIESSMVFGCAVYALALLALILGPLA